MSETFETLHNLVHKGVKVVMDIPYELWNETSAEVADLKKQVQALWPSDAAVEGHHWLGDFDHFTCLASVSSGESQPPTCLAVGDKAQLSSSEVSQCWGFANAGCCD